MTTAFTKERKPGQPGDTTLTWDEAVYTWDEIAGTWDEPNSYVATGFTKEAKPTSAYSRESRPVSGYTKETKP